MYFFFKNCMLNEVMGLKDNESFKFIVYYNYLYYLMYILVIYIYFFYIYVIFMLINDF